MGVKWIFLILLSLFLASCISQNVCDEPYIFFENGCCLDKNSNSVCDEHETETTTDDIVIETSKKINITIKKNEDGYPLEKEKTNDKEKQEQTYDLQQLMKDLDQLYDKKEIDFIQDEDYPDFFNGNEQPFQVIYTHKKLNSGSEFTDIFNPKLWGGYTNFINETRIRWLNPPLEKSNFSKEYDYNEYEHDDYRYDVNQRFIQKTITLQNGKILEYHFINDNVHSGYFRGVWEDTLFMYIIPCTSNLTVIIRPSWERLMIRTQQPIEDALVNWKASLDFVRPELEEKANAILDFCPVTDEYFEDFPEIDFEEVKELVYFWKADLRFFWNLSQNVSVAIEEDDRENGTYWLRQLNMTFVNNEGSTINHPMYLNVEIEMDGERSETFRDMRRIMSKLRNEVVVEKNIVIPEYEDINFKDYLDIDIALYATTAVPVRPIRVHVYTNGSIEISPNT